jgi:hypothetical protein
MDKRALSHTYIHTHVHILSYGILLYELFHCRVPYEQAGYNSTIVLRQAVLKNGARPAINKSCPDEVGKLMRECWLHEPDARPNFDEVSCMTLFCLAALFVDDGCDVSHVCMYVCMYVCVVT